MLKTHIDVAVIRAISRASYSKQYARKMDCTIGSLGFSLVPSTTAKGLLKAKEGNFVNRQLLPTFKKLFITCSKLRVL